MGKFPNLNTPDLGRRLVVRVAILDNLSILATSDLRDGCVIGARVGILVKFTIFPTPDLGNGFVTRLT